MHRAEFHAHVGDANILPNVRDALTRARDLARELELEPDLKKSGEVPNVP